MHISKNSSNFVSPNSTTPFIMTLRLTPESILPVANRRDFRAALCFGWIDSSARAIEGMQLQRFSPRRKNSPWTELNKERVRRLERIGLMTDAGRQVLPSMGARSFRIDDELKAALKKARVWTTFRSFPDLYQRVRAYNVTFYKTRDPQTYQKALSHLIALTIYILL